MVDTWIENFLMLSNWQEEKAAVIQTLLFASGLNTLCQTLFGCRTIAVIGGSHAFVIPAIAIIFSDKYTRIVDPHVVRVFPSDIRWWALFARFSCYLVGFYWCSCPRYQCRDSRKQCKGYKGQSCFHQCFLWDSGFWDCGGSSWSEYWVDILPYCPRLSYNSFVYVTMHIHKCHGVWFL